MGEVQLVSFPDADALAVAAADFWVGAVANAGAVGRKFLVALSGGRVMTKFFAASVKRAGERKVSFGPVEFFWSDERCVPPGDPDSNFRIANELLIQPMTISGASVHRIRGELDGNVAAELATAELRRVSGHELTGTPVLDLVLLGMGEDGHVASLFPHDSKAAADVSSVFLAVENSPKPPSRRVTLGHGPITAAREVWVLASGKDKAAALHESLLPTGRTPLAAVIQARVRTRIFSDIEIT